ncbi:MAG: preprotein translocase subunit SecE [Metamycoplasmataceae bacterium]
MKDKKVKSSSKEEKQKAYILRNFFKEIKRIRWPLDFKKEKNFLLVFVFIMFLIGFFFLISFISGQFINLIGAQ